TSPDAPRCLPPFPTRALPIWSTTTSGTAYIKRCFPPCCPCGRSGPQRRAARRKPNEAHGGIGPSPGRPAILRRRNKEGAANASRSEEHTSELRHVKISYAVVC